MHANRRAVPSFITCCLALTVALVAAGPVTAAPLPLDRGALGNIPRTVELESRVLDAEGMPLNGRRDLTLRYFSTAGVELYAESLSGVEILDGRLQVTLGTGDAAGATRLPSLHSVFAAHPEVELEVMVEGAAFEPRLGILPAGHSLKSRLAAAAVRPAEDDGEHWKGYTEPGGRQDAGAPKGSDADSTPTLRRRPQVAPWPSSRLPLGPS